MAIGKQSKFQKDGKSDLQDKGNSEKKNKSRVEKARSSEEDQDGDEGLIAQLTGSDDTDRFLAENELVDEKSTQEELSQIPEEIQNIKEANAVPRSKLADDKSSNTKSSTTIIHPQNLKSETDLLWDEICNGIKGKNSGIPMGFKRLNKYLGLRRSIYTTIGAAAG